MIGEWPENYEQGTRITGHPDKVESDILISERNCTILASRFLDLLDYWTAKYGLKWNTRTKRLGHNNAWKSWELALSNYDIRITIEGTAFHLEESCRSRGFLKEDSWRRNPFPTYDQISELDPYSTPCLKRLGLIRVTDKCKLNPKKYAAYLSNIYTDLIQFGLDESPRTVEIALDCSNPQIAEALRHSTRLKNGKDTELTHFKTSCGGSAYPGPSLNGDWEYQGHKGYYRQGLRELVCYPRWDCGGFYRTELRLGSQYLKRFLDSFNSPDLVVDAPVHESEASTSSMFDGSSPTLRVLSHIDLLVRRNLIFEALDVDRIYRDHPRTRFLKLNDFTIRGQRYLLRKHADFTSKDFRPYAHSVETPEISYESPCFIYLTDQTTAQSEDHSIEIRKEEESQRNHNIEKCDSQVSQSRMRSDVLEEEDACTQRTVAHTLSSLPTIYCTPSDSWDFPVHGPLSTNNNRKIFTGESLIWKNHHTNRSVLAQILQTSSHLSHWLIDTSLPSKLLPPIRDGPDLIAVC